MLYKKGDVVYAAFPYTDAPLFKKRPVLVISSQKYMKENKHIVGLMITTAKDSQWVSDCPIGNVKAAGLKASSFVRFKFFSISEELIEKKLGGLSGADMAAVQNILKDTLPL